MWKTIAVGALMAALLGSGSWAATLVFQEAGFDAANGRFWVDIAFSGLPPAGVQMCGVSLGVSLTGGGGAITPCSNAASPHPNRYNGVTGANLVAPDIYAGTYSPYYSNSTAAGNVVSFAFLDEALSTTLVRNGYVAGRLHWLWNGQPLQSPALLHIQGYTPGEPPYYVTGEPNYDFMDLQAGPDLVVPVPEPATLSLLAFGAVGLFAARRRAARRPGAVSRIAGR